MTVYSFTYCVCRQCSLLSWLDATFFHLVADKKNTGHLVKWTMTVVSSGFSHICTESKLLLASVSSFRCKSDACVCFCFISDVETWKICSLSSYIIPSHHGASLLPGRWQLCQPKSQLQWTAEEDVWPPSAYRREPRCSTFPPPLCFCFSSVSLRICGHDRTSQPGLFFRLLALWPYRTRLRCVPALNTSFWRAAGCHRVSMRVGDDSGSNHHDADRKTLYYVAHQMLLWSLSSHSFKQHWGASEVLLLPHFGVLSLCSLIVNGAR